MRLIKVAATQMRCSWDLEDNLRRAEKLVREAVSQGSQIVLLQELFETPYFCQQENYEYFQYAKPVSENSAIQHFQKIARELEVVLPISFFERDNNTFFNSLVVIDADGTVMETYRKTHIPDGHSYEEKFYFAPGDTGFKVWDTKYGKIGVGICWDQWFPESARCMALLGAELLLYPTAIGSEPVLKRDSQPHWQRVMQGHAAGNLIPVIASNRIGTEVDETSMTFYGTSFITDSFGQILKQADRETETVIVATIDLEASANERRSWGIYRDRRPEHYKPILGM
jgi:N-carbamoylputrescine amidase